MGSVREDTSGIRSGQGRAMSPGWALRDPVPADNWPHKYTVTPNVPGAGGNPGNNRSLPPRSWQARNGWYSRIAIALTLGALVVLIVVGIAG